MSLFFPIVNKYKWWIKGIHKIKYKKFKSRISDDLWLDNIYYTYQYVLRSCGLHKRIKTHNGSNKNHTPSQIMEILFVLCFIIILMSKDALDITLSFTLTKLCSVYHCFDSISMQIRACRSRIRPSKIQSFRSKYIISNFHFESYLDFKTDMHNFLKCKHRPLLKNNISFSGNLNDSRIWYSLSIFQLSPHMQQ